MAKKKTAAAKRRTNSEDMLDKALAASFPASDPVSVEAMLIPGSHPVKKTAKRAAKSGPTAKSAKGAKRRG